MELIKIALIKLISAIFVCLVIVNIFSAASAGDWGNLAHGMIWALGMLGLCELVG